MNIKQLLLEGCSIKMPYKKEKESWVADADIYIYSGYYSKPRIHVKTPVHGLREFKLDEIDEAIKHFEGIAFSPKNLMYKMKETLCELHSKGDFVDLDDNNDNNRVRTIINEKIKMH